MSHPKRAPGAFAIKGIKDRVDPLIRQAIDSVRSVGNFGVHMEKDIKGIAALGEQKMQSLFRRRQG